MMGNTHTSSIEVPGLVKTPPEPSAVVLLGVPFHDVTTEETLAWIDYLVAARSPAYFATANLDFAAQACGDVELQRILVEARLVLCDGMPLVWASRFEGAPLRERVAGSDLVPTLAEHAEQRGYRIFLLGGDPVALETAAKRLAETPPRLPEVGFYSPPYRPLHDFDNDAVRERITAHRPDILLVAFGCPKQEKWIYANYRTLGAPVSMGVGATVDFLAGKVSRAPTWMRQTGLEWIYRLSQEPGRLWKRYSHDVGFLFRQLLRQRGRLRTTTKSTSGDEPAEATDVTPTLVWTGELVAARLETFPSAPSAGDVRLDLAGITAVDSSGLGLLLRVAREIWARRSKLVLVRPSPAVVRILELTRMERLLPCEGDPSAGGQSEPLVEAPSVDGPQAGEIVATRAPAQFDAGEAAHFIDETRKVWAENPGAKVLQILMGSTGFMDSSGLGALITCHRLASQRQGRLELVQVGDNVRNVLRIARLEALLLGENSRAH